jgi:hypothetical protein
MGRILQYKKSSASAKKKPLGIARKCYKETVTEQFR